MMKKTIVDLSITKRLFKNKPWVSKEVRGILRKRRRVFKMFLKYHTKELWIAYKNYCQYSKTWLLKLKHDWLSHRMLNCKGMNWKKVKKSIPQLFGRKKPLGPILLNGKQIDTGDEYVRAWKRHFEGMLCKDILLKSITLGRFKKIDHFDSDLNVPLTMNEMVQALRMSSLATAPGPDGISFELIKSCGRKTIDSLFSCFTEIWRSEKIPVDWKCSWLIPIPKSGDLTLVDNYRGIVLLSCVGKIFCQILRSRLLRFVENCSPKILYQFQFGFREGKGCLEPKMVLYETVFRRKALGKPTYLLFVDFKKAYDSVVQNLLWKKLSFYGIRGKFLRVLKGLYDGFQMKVLVNGVLSEPFEVKVGVRQGCVLSPLLFLLFINDALDLMVEEDLGICLVGDTHLCLGLFFADDLVLMASSEAMLRRMIEIIENWSLKWSLLFNVEKCGLMKILDSGIGEVRLNNRIVPVVEEYKYLGSIFQQDLEWNMELDRRLEKGRRALFSIKSFLTNPLWSIRVKKVVFQSLVMSVLLYDMELWKVSMDDMKKLESIILWGMRMILKVGKTTPVEMLWMELRMLPLKFLVLTRKVKYLNKIQSEMVLREVLDQPTKGLSYHWNWLTRLSKSCSQIYKVSFRDVRLVVDDWDEFSKGLLERSWENYVDLANKSKKKSIPFYLKVYQKSLPPFMLMSGYGLRKQLWEKLRIGGILLLKQRWEFSHALRRLLPKVYCLVCKKRKREDIYHMIFECEVEELKRIRNCWFEEVLLLLGRQSCLRLEFEKLSGEERLVFLISGKERSLGWDLSGVMSSGRNGCESHSNRVESIGLKYFCLMFKERKRIFDKELLSLAVPGGVDDLYDQDVSLMEE